MLKIIGRPITVVFYTSGFGVAKVISNGGFMVKSINVLEISKPNKVSHGYAVVVDGNTTHDINQINRELTELVRKHNSKASLTDGILIVGVDY